MTTAQQTLVPFIITLKEKAEASGNQGPDYKLVIDGAAFGSDLRQTIWGCSLADGQRMTVGLSYPVLLERGGLGKKRDGGMYDGSKHWMYRWRWGGFQEAEAGLRPAPATMPASAPAAKPVAAVPAAAVIPAPTVPHPEPPAQSPAEAARDRSIQRQVALKAAVDFAIARMQFGGKLAEGEKIDTFHVLRIAESFFGWEQGLSLPADPSAAASPATQAPQSASDEASPLALFPRLEAHFHDMSNLYDFCYQDFGKKPQEVKALLGGSLPVETPKALFQGYLQVKAASGR